MEDIKESSKQFIGVLIRYGMVILFALLVSKKIISQEFADAVLDSATGFVVVMALPVVAIAWSWTVKRFNVLMTRYARRAQPGTSMIDIKKEVLNENKVLPI